MFFLLPLSLPVAFSNSVDNQYFVADKPDLRVNSRRDYLMTFSYVAVYFFEI